MIIELNLQQFNEKVFDIEKANKEFKKLNKDLTVEQMQNGIQPENPEFNYKGELPCIIDFTADWCGPCKTLNPILDELSNEYKDKIIFYKVNVEKEPEIAQVFLIQALPTLLFFPVDKDKKPAGVPGAPPKNVLEQMIKEILNVEKPNIIVPGIITE